MRAPISVIIPTLNAQHTLGTTLTSLLPGLEVGLIRELIISDGGSSDETVALAKEWGAEVVAGVPSRGGQLRRGCDVAQGSWLLVLHADTFLEDGWVGPVIEHIRSDRAGWFSLAFKNGGLAGVCVAAWANLRSRAGLPYGDQGLLVPRVLYDETGGYADQPLMEDVAMARALRGKLGRVDAVAWTSPVRYKNQGWLRRGARNIWTLTRYLAGASPHRLAQNYRR